MSIVLLKLDWVAPSKNNFHPQILEFCKIYPFSVALSSEIMIANGAVLF